jgi:hypothetical protein
MRHTSQYAVWSDLFIIDRSIFNLVNVPSDGKNNSMLWPYPNLAVQQGPSQCIEVPITGNVIAEIDDFITLH